MQGTSTASALAKHGSIPAAPTGKSFSEEQRVPSSGSAGSGHPAATKPASAPTPHVQDAASKSAPPAMASLGGSTSTQAAGHHSRNSSLGSALTASPPGPHVGHLTAENLQGLAQAAAAEAAGSNAHHGTSAMVPALLSLPVPTSPNRFGSQAGSVSGAPLQGYVSADAAAHLQQQQAAAGGSGSASGSAITGRGQSRLAQLGKHLKFPKGKSKQATFSSPLTIGATPAAYEAQGSASGTDPNKGQATAEEFSPPTASQPMGALHYLTTPFTLPFRAMARSRVSASVSQYVAQAKKTMGLPASASKPPAGYLWLWLGHFKRWQKRFFVASEAPGVLLIYTRASMKGKVWSISLRGAAITPDDAHPRQMKVITGNGECLHHCSKITGPEEKLGREVGIVNLVPLQGLGLVWVWVFGGGEEGGESKLSESCHYLRFC